MHFLKMQAFAVELLLFLFWEIKKNFFFYKKNLNFDAQTLFMSNYFDPTLSYTILFMLAIALIMGIKNYYYKKYRSAKSQGRFLKSFIRWYGQSDMGNDKFPASKKIYMGISNRINVLFWLLVIGWIIALIAYIHFLIK